MQAPQPRTSPAWFNATLDVLLILGLWKFAEVGVYVIHQLAFAP